MIFKIDLLMRRQFALTLGLSLLNREERTDYRFSAQKGTLTVHFQTSANFTKLRSNLVITLATAYFTCSILLPVSLGLQRSQATHNPLVHGSSPCGPTKYQKAARFRGFFMPIDQPRRYARFFDTLFACVSGNRSASQPFMARPTVFGTGFSPLR